MNSRTSLRAGSAATLALWFLAAHFYRMDVLIPATVTALAPLLLLIPSRAARVVVQLMLLMGALEWLRTLATLTATRLSMQQPWLRMALILLAVAAFTAGAAWLLRRGTSRSA
ncbi:MAG: hypothetical protein ACK54C_18150 [Betaproteobacteria bacterium]